MRRVTSPIGWREAGSTEFDDTTMGTSGHVVESDLLTVP